MTIVILQEWKWVKRITRVQTTSLQYAVTYIKYHAYTQNVHIDIRNTDKYYRIYICKAGIS